MTFNYYEIGKILWNSFLAAFKWNIWKWFFGSIGAFGATFLIGKNLFKLDLQESIIWGAIIIIILFLLRFVLIFFKESLKYFHEQYKNSNYGDAIILLNECFAAMHNYRKTPGHDDEEFVKSMLLLCNNLKIIFTNLVKAECSVSIKVPIADDSIKPQTLLSNLVRDIDHRPRDTEQYSKIEHSLLGNTAFSYCLNKVSIKSKKKCYKNNNVNKTENYENTSKQCYEKEVLPYNSELVYPITPIIDGNHICLGFICIDSVKTNAFGSKYEIAILEGVADGIFDIINERNQFKIQ
ncbi:hypothetical protein [Flavobacterium ginsenosidimutans]|uniref:hypothetical protein n=1 Tax=Flavobacterium ginsenosidimutans TaxID=687844 RepID=UPI000DADEB47|nr:hypothetical protein [Flavobacterium ginsenosidimutans]KAF2338026.1 hypothetical protein DM444_01215 [Flavobacterium ginsenosidimutans]